MPARPNEILSGDASGYKWRVAMMLGLIALLNYADRSAISAVFPLLRRDLDMSNVALAATGSFFLWSYALASPFLRGLGTGTPTPSTRRAGSSFLAETKAETFLFDCGPGSHVRMLEAGVSPTRVGQMFVSHWHYDHFMDLPHLLLRRWDQGAGKIPELKVYGPEPVERIVRQLFGSDVLVHMCHYLTGSHLDEGMLRGCGSHKMVAEVARDAGVKTLVLTHLTDQMDVAGVRERAIHEISAIFGGNVIWG